jgi:hypothetical protein
VVINGRTRIPDGVNRAANALSEVKNVRSLSYTRQLRDYAKHAADEGMTFDLYVRGDDEVVTDLSTPLIKAIRDGEVKLKYIPWPFER